MALAGSRFFFFVGLSSLVVAIRGFFGLWMMNEYPVTLVECEACGLVLMSIIPYGCPWKCEK